MVRQAAGEQASLFSAPGARAKAGVNVGASMNAGASVNAGACVSDGRAGNTHADGRTDGFTSDAHAEEVASSGGDEDAISDANADAISDAGADAIANEEILRVDDDAGDTMDSIPAGWPEEIAEGCVRLDPAAVLRAKPRSFALRVRGHSMVGAGIYDGDIVVGEFTPEARPGAIVVALIDGESTLKRFVMHNDRPHLASENPNCPDLIPLTELVIQGVVHSIVHRVEKLLAISC